ncbi:MAG: DUF4387 domain-containing protein [Candidatus Hodarchaeota archaeon]
MARIYLENLCNVIRSKNAGPFLTTLDIMFKDYRDYRKIVEKGLLTKKIVAQVYGIPEEDITNFETFDNVSAIKATIKRNISSGSPGDSDCYGMNQEAPLLRISFPSELFSGNK